MLKVRFCLVLFGLFLCVESLQAKTFSIVYYSAYGTNKKVAQEIQKGLEKYNAQVHLLDAEELLSKDKESSDKKWDLLNESDAIIFGTPTYMGNVAGKFKLFMDESARVFMDRKWKDKFAAGFTNSGGLSGDKLNTLTSLAIFAAQHEMVWISLGIRPDGSKPENINRLGSFLGLMTQVDPFSKNKNKDLTSGDAKTARMFGERIASFVNSRASR